MLPIDREDVPGRIAAESLESGDLVLRACAQDQVVVVGQGGVTIS
jgi:hypothetical protein